MSKYSKLENKINEWISKEVYDIIRSNYGSKIKVFDSQISLGVTVEEVSAKGMSIYAYDLNGKVSDAYQGLTKEVLSYAEKKVHYLTILY